MTRSGRLPKDSEKSKDPSQAEDNIITETDRQAEWSRLSLEFDRRLGEAVATLANSAKGSASIHIVYFENIPATLRQWLSQHAQVFPQEERNLQGQYVQSVVRISELLKTKLVNLRDKGQGAEVFITVLDYRPYNEMLYELRKPPELFESAGEGSMRSHNSSTSSRYGEANRASQGRPHRSRGNRQRRPWQSPRRSQTSQRYRTNREYESEELLFEMSRYSSLPPPWNKEPSQSTRLERLDVSRLVQTAGEHVFSGRVEDYIQWRDFFIGTLGDVRCLARHKVNALRRALEPLLHTLVDYAPGDFNGYSEIVHSLEKAYGGLFRQMKRYDDYFDRGEKFKYGSLDLFREFCRKVAGYKALLIQTEQRDLFDMPHIYRRLLLPLPGAHIRELQTWLHSSGRLESASNLLIWAQDRLDRMMMETEVDRRKPKPRFEEGALMGTRGPQARVHHVEYGYYLGQPEEEPDEYRDDISFEDEGQEMVHVVFQPPDDMCLLGCDRGHLLTECERFLQLKPKTRRGLIRMWRCVTCYACLRIGHAARNCKTGTACKYCQAVTHHTLLHIDSDVSIHFFSIKLGMTSTRPRVLLPLVAVEIKYKRKTKRVYAMIDSGATVSIISEPLAQYLNIPMEYKSLKMATAAGMVDTEATFFRGKIKSLLEKTEFPFSGICFRSRDVFQGMEIPNFFKIIQRYSYLKDISLDNIKVEGVDILIGNDHACLIAPTESVSGTISQPIAERSKLGWSLRGPVDSVYNAVVSEQELSNPEEMTCVIEQSKVENLLKKVEESWELPERLANPYMTNADRVANTILASTLKLNNGRMQAGILWKEANPPIVPNNRFMALKRLQSLHNHLEKYPEVKEHYYTNMRDWINEGTLIKVAERGVAGKTNYLSHFPVTNMTKTTSKVRTVVDASAKYRGVSLNDFILAGPNLANDIRRVLTRFRKKRIAIIGDVKSMFTRIKLLDSERDYHRVLWNEQGREVEEYCFTCFTFGNTCSPAIAISAARYLADLKPGKIRAREIVYHSTIVDDSLDAVDTNEEAINILRDLQSIYKQGSMCFRKIGSNSLSVLEAFPISEVSEPIKNNLMNIGEQIEIKALGVGWDPSSDTLYFDVDLAITVKSRRGILSELAKVYDPLGLITPILIKFKILVQESWTLKIGWDSAMPNQVIEEWKRLVEAARGRLKFERALVNELGVIKQEIHFFVDASEKALGAVAYLKTVYWSGKKVVHLIMSRSRVAPLKQVSIPRLELQAATEAAEMTELILNTMNISPKNTFFWTDSVDVIAWLNSPSRNLKVFVSNRVGLVQARTWTQHWKWVPTKNNPADLISRGSSSKDLESSSLWKHGPSFLKSEEYPEQPKFKMSDKAKKDLRHKIRIMVVQTPQQGSWKNKLSRFSSWYKFVKACSLIRKKLTKQPSLNHINDIETEKILIRLLQNETWPEEYNILKKGNKLPNKNNLCKYGLFYHKEWETLHVSGRISTNEHLPFLVRFPYIVPHKSHWGTLLIREIHTRDMKHLGGIRSLTAKILQKFFIPKLQVQVKRILKKCVICQKRKFKPNIPPWAPLPNFRLPQGSRSAPFQMIAIDCMGPLYVDGKVIEQTSQTENKKRPGRPKNIVKEITLDKSYVLVISCTLYRCTHLEVLQQLSVEALLMALDRFIATRGRPELVISDNARNFIGTSNLLQEELAVLENEMIKNYPKIQWQFTTPLDPHKNGVVERIVGLTKDYLAKLTLNRPMTFEQLRTFIKMVEAGLNNRPLQPIDVDALEQEPLTPNHFLRGSAYNSLLPKDTISNTLEAWKTVSSILDKYWNRFLTQIVPELNISYKKNQRVIDYKEGQLVLVQENFAQAGINFPSYPMAKILEVYRGQDGIVRSVKLKFQDKDIIRGVSKISPLFY